MDQNVLILMDGSLAAKKHLKTVENQVCLPNFLFYSLINDAACKMITLCLKEHDSDMSLLH